MALVMGKYQKCRKNIILVERWHFVFWGFITVFSRWNRAPQYNGQIKFSFFMAFLNFEYTWKSDVVYLFIQNDRNAKINTHTSKPYKHKHTHTNKNIKQRNKQMKISNHGNLVWSRECAIQCKPRPSPRPIS